MAYNRYQYGTSPRKLQPEYEPQVKRYPKKSTAKKAKVETKKRVKTRQKEKRKVKPEAKMMLYVAIGFMILLAIRTKIKFIYSSKRKRTIRSKH